MNDIDTQKQWRALDETYNAMSDEELCSLAEKAYDLTDLAKQALTAKLAARNLDVALMEQPTAPASTDGDRQDGNLDPNDLDLVPIARVWDSDDAAMVMNKLYEAGVPAYLGRENVEKVSEFHSSFDSGVDIKVRGLDEQRALLALRQASPQPEGEPQEEVACVVLCPACKSDEVVFEELVATTSDSSTPQKFHWRCDHCGHEWEDDGIED